MGEIMKSYRALLALIILASCSTAQVQAGEAYCALNDGMKADGKTALEHDGAKHEFCCSGCLEKFKADPKNFAQKIQQPSITSPAEAEAACSSVCSE